MGASPFRWIQDQTNSLSSMRYWIQKEYIRVYKSLQKKRKKLQTLTKPTCKQGYPNVKPSMGFKHRSCHADTIDAIAISLHSEWGCGSSVPVWSSTEEWCSLPSPLNNGPAWANGPSVLWPLSLKSGLEEPSRVGSEGLSANQRHRPQRRPSRSRRGGVGLGQAWGRDDARELLRRRLFPRHLRGHDRHGEFIITAGGGGWKAVERSGNVAIQLVREREREFGTEHDNCTLNCNI